jgi:hypothetical protein
MQICRDSPPAQKASLWPLHCEEIVWHQPSQMAKIAFLKEIQKITRSRRIHIAPFKA